MKIPSLQTRAVTLTREANTENENDLTFSFSSEAPVCRGWGNEILAHDSGCADFSRMTSAPYLWNHDRNVVLGRVKAAWIDGKRGYCTIRWSSEEEAQKYKRQVDEEILSNVSFAYSIDDVRWVPNSDDYWVMRWTPLEVSLVSVPADHTVGIGRAYESKMLVVEREHIDTAMEENLDNIRGEAVKAERERIATITALEARHGFADLANDLITNGATIERAREEFLNKISANPQPVAQPVNPLGLTDKEQRSYSIVKAINAAVNQDWSRAGFERECSLEIAKRTGKDAKGFFVPLRDLKVEQRAPYAVGAAATGGNVVQTDLLAQNFIDILRNRIACVKLGATFLSGLQGPAAIPRQNAATATYWVGENGAITESEATFDQVPLSPKTIAARSQLSRLMLLQSSVDIEQFIRMDFAKVIALGIDLAAIAGTGTNNQPTGILNTSGIGSIAIGTNGGAPTWAAIVGLETEVSQDNADVGSLAYLTNAKAKGKLKTTLKSASSVSEFIWQDTMISEGMGAMNGYKAMASNQVPSNLTKGSGTNLSAAIFGNWADLIIAEWGVLEILPNPYGAGYNSGAVDIRVMQTVDIAVRHFESFAACTDLSTT